jgi:hypothetical protein
MHCCRLALFDWSIDYDGFAKSHNSQLFVIPAQAGIQEFKIVTNWLDTRLRGYDDFLRAHHFLLSRKVALAGLIPVAACSSQKKAGADIV